MVLANKQKREDEEAERLAELARRAELRAMKRQADKVLAPDLTDEQVMAQVIAAGGDPNMSIEQARIITHNARVGNVIRAAEQAYQSWLVGQNKSQTGPPAKTYLTDDEWEAQHMPGASERSLAEFYEQQLAEANANSHIQLDVFWEAARALPPHDLVAERARAFRPQEEEMLGPADWDKIELLRILNYQAPIWDAGKFNLHLGDGAIDAGLTEDLAIARINQYFNWLNKTPTGSKLVTSLINKSNQMVVGITFVVGFEGIELPGIVTTGLQLPNIPGLPQSIALPAELRRLLDNSIFFGEASPDSLFQPDDGYLIRYPERYYASVVGGAMFVGPGFLQPEQGSELKLTDIPIFGHESVHLLQKENETDIKVSLYHEAEAYLVQYLLTYEVNELLQIATGSIETIPYDGYSEIVANAVRESGFPVQDLRVLDQFRLRLPDNNVYSEFPNYPNGLSESDITPSIEIDENHPALQDTNKNDTSD